MMQKYLIEVRYIAPQAFEWNDESSMFIFVVAPSEQDAASWGEQAGLRMVEDIYVDYNIRHGRDLPLRAGFCGAWVEDASEWNPEWLADFPVITVGEYVKDKYGGTSSFMSGM